MSINELLALDNDDIIVTKDGMVVKGNSKSVAHFFLYLNKDETDKLIDELLEKSQATPEEQNELTKGTQEAIISTPLFPELTKAVKNLTSTKGESRNRLLHKIVKSNVYPKPRDIALSYIKSFNGKYNRDNAINFIKYYLGRRRITNAYRKRVLMSILGMVNKTGERFHSKTKIENLVKEVVKSQHKPKRPYTKKDKKFWNRTKKRKWVKVDYDSLAKEYALMKDKPSINKFLTTKINKKIGGEYHKAFNKALDKLIIMNVPIEQNPDRTIPIEVKP